MATLNSLSNPKIKQIRALQQRKQRSASGLFVVEGIHHVGEAFAAGADVKYVCYAPELLTSEFAKGLVDEQERRGVPCYAVTANIFTTLAEKENPQGILAVVGKRSVRLAELNPDNLPWGVALLAPQDPGNIGAILRTIDAVGASGLVLLENSADPYHPSAVRASMGTLFWYPVVHSGFEEFARWARQGGYHIYGTSAHGSLEYHDVPRYERPLILLMGSERQGLSAEHAAICQALVRLPMLGRASSLNLAVATGVMLYAILARSAGFKNV